MNKITLTKIDYKKLLNTEKKYILHCEEMNEGAKIFVENELVAIIDISKYIGYMTTEKMDYFPFNFPIISTVEMEKAIERGRSPYHYFFEIEQLMIIKEYETKNLLLLENKNGKY